MARLETWLTKNYIYLSLDNGEIIWSHRVTRYAFPPNWLLILPDIPSYWYTMSIAVRSAKFIARKQWVVAGADDMFIRVYNYNTMDKVKVFEAHTDYIRCVAVHPTQPFVLSSSDDMLIKLWDWDKGWTCTHIFEGHSHYVMQVTFNPKDTNTFASASLDRTIKVCICSSKRCWLNWVLFCILVCTLSNILILNVNFRYGVLVLLILTSH